MKYLRNSLDQNTPGSNLAWNSLSCVARSFRQHSSHVGLCTLDLQGGDCDWVFTWFLLGEKLSFFKWSTRVQEGLILQVSKYSSERHLHKSYACTWEILDVYGHILYLMIQWLHKMRFTSCTTLAESCTIRYGNAHAASICSSNWYGWLICKVTTLSCSTGILLTQYVTFNS